MKNVFLFVVIITICGSFSIEPIKICQFNLKQSYYLKGKLQHYDIDTALVLTEGGRNNVICWKHKNSLTFEMDSMVVEPYQYRLEQVSNIKK